MQKHISSGAIVFQTSPVGVRVLLLYRKATNSWHLPKGTQRVGETLKETAGREVQEETGLQVRLESYVGKLDSLIHREDNTVPKETHYFLAKVFSGDVASHDCEHDEVHFMDFKTALNHLENFSLHEKEGEILRMAERVLCHAIEKTH